MKDENLESNESFLPENEGKKDLRMIERKVSSYDWDVFDEIPQSNLPVNYRSKVEFQFQHAEMNKYDFEFVEAKNNQIEDVLGNETFISRKVLQNVIFSNSIGQVITSDRSTKEQRKKWSNLSVNALLHNKPGKILLPIQTFMIDDNSQVTFHPGGISFQFKQLNFILADKVEFNEVPQSYLCGSFSNNLITKEKCDFFWNTMVKGCEQTCTIFEELNLFRKVTANVKSVEVFFSVILPTCVQLMTLHMKKQCYAYVIRTEFGRIMYLSHGRIVFFYWIRNQ